ncbi:MAG: DUF4153 domain-containing protein [bacterium]|nr:DUF4153 domain-containing protein [bacterium]
MSNRFSLFRFLSIRTVALGITDVAKRFPVVLAGTVCVAVMGVLLTENDEYNGGGLVHFSDSTEEILGKILLMCALGIVLLTAATLFSERKKLKTHAHYGLQLGCIGLLVIYYFTLKDFGNAPDYYSIRYALFASAAALLLLIAPFLINRSAQGMWQHGKTLFIRLIISFIFAGVLWGGIALSIEAVRFLFELNFDRILYLELWIVCASIIAPWIFLSGIPRDFEPLEKDTSYPRILEGFTKFILLPLLALFTLVLYAYLAKILITQEWPVGGVVWWIISFTSFGLATFLLKYPLERRYTWVRRVFTVFFSLLVPIIAVHFIAIGLRVGQYGITINRFYIMLFGTWLLGMTVYFLASKTRNILVIPFSLAVILIVFSIGPWSAFAFSQRSQMDRLEKLLTENGILVDGKIKKSEKELAVEDCRSIRSTTNYLNTIHGLDVLDMWLEPSSKTLADAFGTSDYERMEGFYKMIGANCDMYSPYQDDTSRRYYFVDKTSNDVLSLGNKTFFIPTNYLTNDNSYQQFKIENETAGMTLKNNIVTVTKGGVTLATLDLGEKTQLLQSAYPYRSAVPEKELILISETPQALVRLYVDRIEFSENKDAKPTINNISTSAVITLK